MGHTAIPDALFENQPRHIADEVIEEHDAPTQAATLESLVKQPDTSIRRALHLRYAGVARSR